jgi:hypothetical protein
MRDTSGRASRFAAVVCFLLGFFAVDSAEAREVSSRRLVIVLRPSPASGETWSEGTQAVVAELVAGGYELTLRASAGRDRSELLHELVAVASDEPVLGAVVVVREGERGMAYVYTPKSGTVSIETGVSEGAVGEGAVALRITQVLGPPHLDVPPRPIEETRPAPTDTPAQTPPVKPPERRSLLASVSAGLVFSSDLAEPLPFAGVGLRRRLVGPLSVEAAGAFSLGASRIETAAGSVDLTAQEVTLHLAFEPFGDERFAFSLGLGGGVVWTQGSGEPNGGYVGSEDSARVAVLSARAAACFTHNDWSLLLGIDPGVLLPAVNVGAGGEAVRLGRPWTTAGVGLGWNFR